MDRLFGGGPKCPKCGKTMSKSKTPLSYDSDMYLCKSCGVMMQKKR